MTVVTDADATALWKMHRPVTEVGAWEHARATLGKHFVTGPDGTLSLERPSGVFNVCASAANGWAERWVFESATSEVEFELERDRAFSVRVVDESSAPQANIAVALYYRGAGDQERNSGFVAWQALVESDSAGIARFPHAQRWLAAQEGMETCVALAIPLATPVELVLDTERVVDDESFTLVLPPTGVVEVVTGVTRGVVRLRSAAPLDSRAARMWSNYAPLRVLLDDHRARFAHVGLGQELELEVTWEGLVEPVRARFAAPTLRGETVRHELPDLATKPVLVGRLLDEELRPLAERRVGYTIVHGTRKGSSSRGWQFDTDAQGRFRLTLSSESPSEGEYRQLNFHVSAEVSALVDLTRTFTAAEYDLGDIVVVENGSDVWLRRLSDDELLAKHAEIRHLLERDGNHEREFETLLCEVVRRGGERWIAFLQAELDALRERQSNHACRVNEPPTLVWLTALRRAQQRPDPLAIEIEGAGLLEATWAERPELRLRLINVDPAESYEWYSRPPIEQFRIDLLTATGAVVPLRKDYDTLPRGISHAPGQFEGLETCSLALHSYFNPLAAGEYVGRVFFHPSNAIVFAPNARGWILSTSQPFTLRIKP